MTTTSLLSYQSDDHLISVEGKLDDRGETNYENIFKNRTSGKNNKYRRDFGNSLSDTGSRPSGGVTCTARLAEKMVNRDIQQYHAVDTHQIETKSGLYRKTTVQTIVPYEPKIKINQQRHKIGPETNICKPMKKTLYPPMICYLGEIDPRLWLGNAQCLKYVTTLQNRRIKHVIDFSDEDCDAHTLTPHRVQHHQIKFHDSLNISHKEFKQILQKTIDIMDQISFDENILIVCNAGINRSVAVVIGYAILKKSMSFENALDIVENSKKDDKWYNLTNLRLLRLLREIQSTVPIKSLNNHHHD